MVGSKAGDYKGHIMSVLVEVCTKTVSDRLIWRNSKDCNTILSKVNLNVLAKESNSNIKGVMLNIDWLIFCEVLMDNI